MTKCYSRVVKPSLADVLELDLAERLEFVQALWDSIAEAPESLPLSDGERRILDERLEAYYDDPKAGSPWADVRARLTGE